MTSILTLYANAENQTNLRRKNTKTCFVKFPAIKENVVNIYSCFYDSTRRKLFYSDLNIHTLR